MEVNPPGPLFFRARARLLHVRGGQPATDPTVTAPVLSSPRAWRSTVTSGRRCAFPPVFSTCVEVNRGTPWPRPAACGLLHVRGGQPTGDDPRPPARKSSPRAWRSTFFAGLEFLAHGVFSTCVEVNRRQPLLVSPLTGLLHVRGGQPGCPNFRSAVSGSSPRAWRSTDRHPHGSRSADVFSTCVEVNRFSNSRADIPKRLLHVRGGQPRGHPRTKGGRPSSPRAWRSTRMNAHTTLAVLVFSTCVEVNLAKPCDMKIV